ncbi:Zinc transporter zip10 [Plakobranchus ocellatus]|uniref:Zinc transporter zip10 n=1 Tax=Plakobranchus ocellatus TaxID=259542 RepID=A0AAV3YV51_9GAST|nr:Zinc transporter zip10 [Plakobranchus ocellatus]
MLPALVSMLPTVTVFVLLVEGHGQAEKNDRDLPWHEHVHEHENDSSAFNVTLDTVALEESLFFVRKLFNKYGNDETLSHADLLSLLEEIGMDVKKLKDVDSSHVSTRSVRDVQHIHSTHEECVTINEMLSAFHLGSSHHLTPQEFSYLCPAIVFQLEQEDCRVPPNHNHDGHHHHDHSHGHGDHGHEPGPDSHGHHHEDHDHSDEHEATVSHVDISNIPGKVWGFSCVAVLIISLVGLLGVAVIPIMQKVFYNHLLQFLVALAIGALSGDALLHLLPHSIMGEHQHKHGEADAEEDEERQHRSAAFKGLVALTGILFFFIVERLLTIITVIKRNKRSEKQGKKKRCAKYCDVESNKKSMKAKLSRSRLSDDGCDKTVMLVHPNKEGGVVPLNPATGHCRGPNRGLGVPRPMPSALRGLADAAHDEFMHQCDDDTSSPNGIQKVNGDSNAVLAQQVVPSAAVTDHPGSDSVDEQAVSDRDVEMMEMMAGFSEGGVTHVRPVSSGHSHGSHHGHAHSVPTSVAAVAWMVILGDGIHNFSDGLAIGAAFASSITGGFSTSIAVFCHELPHEIGDFAVLLRAGMTAKQAIMYNCLSSLLCFIGMLIGVALGTLASVSEWIFACVGGMFLYIALVDMLPEMTAVDPKKGENPFLHLLLQVLGIMLGSSVMLVIAIYEHNIKQTFG